MDELSSRRLWILRATYAFIALGLFATAWPDILAPETTQADVDTAVLALLGGVSVMAAWGIFDPVRMLPILVFEFVWKVIWVVAFAMRMAADTGLDAYAMDTLFACALGIVIVPLALPWEMWLGKGRRVLSERSSP